MAARKALEEREREVEVLKREKIENERQLEEKFQNVSLGSSAKSAISTTDKENVVSCPARQKTFVNEVATFVLIDSAGLCNKFLTM